MDQIYHLDVSIADMADTSNIAVYTENQLQTLRENEAIDTVSVLSYTGASGRVD